MATSELPSHKLKELPIYQAGIVEFAILSGGASFYRVAFLELTGLTWVPGLIRRRGIKDHCQYTIYNLLIK